MNTVEEYAKGQILPLGYFSLNDFYSFFYSLVEENRIKKIDFSLLGYEDIHELFAEYLPKLFDDLIKNEAEGYTECSEALLNLGVKNNLEAVDEIIRLLCISVNEILEYVEIKDFTKLFVNVVEEKALPMALLSYINN